MVADDQSVAYSHPTGCTLLHEPAMSQRLPLVVVPFEILTFTASYAVALASFENGLSPPALTATTL